LFAIIFVPSFVFAQTANQQAFADLSKQVQDLLKQVQDLQQQIAVLKAELGKQSETPTALAPVAETPTATPPELTRFLSRGASGNDVSKLQNFLAKDKEIYPEGLITGYFGPLTEAAVKKWQEKHGIESAGSVGLKTIAKFQELSKEVKQGLMNAPEIYAIATTTLIQATSTVPSGTIPAVPAIPAVPSSESGAIAVPATPATPAIISSTLIADTAAPSAPTGLTASSTSSSQITLYWNASTDNVGVAGYKIYRNGSYLTSVTTLSYSDTGLSAGTSYSYTVAAYDAAGNVSAQSSSISITTLSSTAANSSSLSVTSLSPTSGPNGIVITLTGTGFYSANAPSYMDALCFLTAPTACVNAYTVPISNTQIQFTVPSSAYLPAKTYNLILQAYNGSSNLTQTFTVTTTTITDTAAPSTPTELGTSPISSSQINLSWTASTDNIGVTGYKIYRNSNYLTSVTSTSYNDTGLSAATSYNYTVAAYDAAGNVSAQSGSVSAMTQSAQLSLPAPTAGDTGTSHLGAVFGAGGTAPAYAGIYVMGVRFQYDALSTSMTQSFHVYQKKPGESAFSIVATFPNPSSLISGGGSIRSGTFGAPGSWTLNYIPTPSLPPGAFWEAQTSNSQNLSSSSNFPVGRYDSYVVAVNSSGAESLPSATMTHFVLDRTSISSPISLQSTLNPIFTWSVASGWPQSPSYQIKVYTSSALIWTSSVSVNTSVSSASKTYDGPALDSTQTYTVFIDAPGLANYNGNPYTSMNAATQTFTVTGNTTSSSDLRAKNLAAVSKIADSLSVIMKKLLKILQELH
jgi:chitodextrinase